jgi:3-hydroxyisobutyrate dehydrogenase-like beta-hydroxyacid dehydrogenase
VSGVVACGAADLLVIDASTTSPACAVARAATLSEQGIAYVDAPLSGGPARAESGELTVMLAGSLDHVERARAVLRNVASRTFATGQVGTAQIVKACNNLLIAAITAANAEALTLGAAAGIDVERLHAILTTCTGTNWQLENVVPRTVLTGDYKPGFALSHMLKDLAIIHGMVDDLGLSTPVTHTAKGQFAEAALRFGEGSDFSVVTKLIDERNAIDT